MPAVWFALKRSLQCKSELADVHDPKGNGSLRKIQTRKLGRCGCSRSISHIKDVVIHGSKRHTEKLPGCSPRSIGSSEFQNPITHEVTIDDSTCELKITGFGNGGGHGGEKGCSAFVGTLRTGTPGPEIHSRRLTTCSSSSREIFNGGKGISSKGGKSFDGSSCLICHKCGEEFNKIDAAESHHLSNHAVSELVEGDSSRKIVELICRTSWKKSENKSGRIEKVLKVHNMQKTLAQFEEYREMVKIKASKLPKKHPRCLADGNELLRFYGTNIACNLGLDGCCSLCTMDECGVCSILRHGFGNKREVNGNAGGFTTSTSERALDSIAMDKENQIVRKALIVCRVIGGRVHRPLENSQQLSGQSGFDSLAGKMGLYPNIEELFLLNTKALLPCFVVICRP